MMNSGFHSPARPHLVWFYTGSPFHNLDAATWLKTTHELRQLGWQVTLVTTGPAGRQVVQGVEVFCIPKPDVYFLRQLIFHLKALWLIFRMRNTTDVLLFHQLSAPWFIFLWIAQRLTGRNKPLLVMDTRDVNRVYVSLKNRLRARFIKFGHWLANRWADGQLAITPRMARLVQIPSQKLWGTWPSGVNLEQFSPAAARRRWPANGEPLHLIYTGSMDCDRNLMSICQAVEKANNANMNFVLSLFGAGTERPTLEKFALGTTGRIHVMPPVSHHQVPELLAQAHIGVAGLALLDDKIFEASSPVKLFEYMAAGLPVLCSRSACYTEVVGDDEFAFWIESTSQDGLLAALRLIWQNRYVLPRMGQEAAEAAKAWTWTEAAKKMKAALENGLARFAQARSLSPQVRQPSLPQTKEMNLQQFDISAGHNTF